MPQEVPAPASPRLRPKPRASDLHSTLGTLESAWIWFAVVTLVLAWLPLIAIVRVFDRDPVHYRTGRWFRRLGIAITRVNPAWHVHIRSTRAISHPRRPYIVVSNHQSMADIPLLSHLPWEMKWVAKRELFRLPLLGWMMRMAGDIPVHRTNARSGARAMITAGRYLEQNCSIMFFPEGTRSRDGRVGAFNDGAFHLAARLGLPVLPIAVEGSRDCLPRKSWKFGRRKEIVVQVLTPILPTGSTKTDVVRLRDQARGAIIHQLAAWRGLPEAEIDAIPASDRTAP